MTDDTLIIDGDEQVDVEDNMNGMEGDEEDDYLDDAELPDDPEDDDFKLDGGDDVGFAENDDDDDAKDYDPESDDESPSKKRKRNVPGFVTRSLHRSTVASKAPDAEAFILDEDNEYLFKQTSRVPGTFGRRNRRKGETLPAYHKRVSHELDSDDELMMDMREKGFSDRQIADKLAKDGRIRYDQKSISTRIGRIRVAQAENVDFLLKEGYKEWEFEDDCLLMQAHALADIEISYEMERIRAWRFRKVSDYMRRLNKDALFSAAACRDRYNALMNGTARIPTDLDDDPDARRAETEAWRKSREAVRSATQAEKDEKDALERKAKDEVRSRNAQKAEELASKRAAKETDKAQRAMARATQAQLRAQRASQNQAAKAQRNAQIKKQKDEHEARRTRKKRAANTNVTLKVASTKEVNTATPDPRGYLTLDDLEQLCEDRGIEVDGKDKAELVQGLKDADDEYSAIDLKTMCRAKGLNANISKMQMKYQLALAAAQLFSSFDAGVAAAAEEEEELDVK